MMTFEMQIPALAFYSESVCMHACIHTFIRLTCYIFYECNANADGTYYIYSQIANNRQYNVYYIVYKETAQQSDACKISPCGFQWHHRHASHLELRLVTLHHHY